MTGIRLGGIDPSILRELSGVYKPFVKAFKELISNAYDADATRVSVKFDDDFSSVTAADDGCGMTLFEFRNDFTRIGGGSRRWAGDRTRKGRLRIGSKGIGFLALARYCDRLRIRSLALRPHVQEWQLDPPQTRWDLLSLVGVPLNSPLLASRARLDVRRRLTRGPKLRENSAYSWNKARTLLTVAPGTGPVTLSLSVDCTDLGFEAVLDFDRLLRLADNANLESLQDFATIQVFEVGSGEELPGTHIRAEGLKSFVRRELRSDRRKGYVRNIQSRSGLEQFTWLLSRSTPIPYSVPVENVNTNVANWLELTEQLTLDGLEVHHGSFDATLRRPIYPFEPEAKGLPPDLLIPVDIAEDGLHARGFLAGSETVIFPAEYRGIAIRVRGVAIGDPGFLGTEHLLTGAQKAALSQITGEVNILSGLDAVDSLNPGRESFYEESDHYKILRRHLVGEGEALGGILGRAVGAVIRRSEAKSSLADALGRATFRRHALENVSAAITYIIASEEGSADLVRVMLRSHRSEVNGLASASDFDLSPPLKIGGIPVVVSRDQEEPAAIDYVAQEVKLDPERAGWNWALQLHDRRFTVINKKGGPEHPVAAIDLKAGRIYVNWTHPMKQQMDERGFLRTALALILSKEASADDTSRMMELLLKLLSFSTHHDG